MDIFFELIFRFVIKWFNRVNLEAPIETWSVLEWIVFCVIILILFSVLYMLLTSCFGSRRKVFNLKKKR